MILDIIAKHGLRDFDQVLNIAQVAIECDQEYSHLVFAYNCQGLLGFTDAELCEVFLHALWLHKTNKEAR